MSLFQRMMLKEILPRIINQNRNAYTHENYRTQKKNLLFLDFIGENLNRIIKLIYLFSRLALK